MASNATDQDEIVSQFCAMTGTRPSEVSIGKVVYLGIALLKENHDDRLASSWTRTSGTSRPQSRNSSQSRMRHYKMRMLEVDDDWDRMNLHPSRLAVGHWEGLLLPPLLLPLANLPKRDDLNRRSLRHWETCKPAVALESPPTMRTKTRTSSLAVKSRASPCRTLMTSSRRSWKRR